MTKPHDDWTVLPHGELVQLEENLLTVTGEIEMPLGKSFPRRMTVARLDRGDLVVYSAIALSEPAMAQLERFGRPRWLVVPGAIHRLDAGPWKKRYPALEVIAPEAARAHVEEVVHVDATHGDFGDPRVRYFTVPGTGRAEAALEVLSERGTTLVLNDLLFNVDDRPGLGGWLLKRLGFTGDAPHVPPLIKLRQVKDKAALASQLEVWSHVPTLRRVIVSHGEVIEKDPGHVLERVAREIVA